MATGCAVGPGMGEGKATPIQAGCKKVAIVGCAETKSQAPFGDQSWEIWGVNNLYLHIPRWTRWFEIHSIMYDEIKKKWFRRMNPDLKKGTYEWSDEFRGQPVGDYIAGLAKMDCPVYMQRHWDAVPGSKPYPLKEVLGRFPRQYFTNTISWMLALAIYEGFQEINVYGVDMAVGCLAPETKVLTADLRWVPCGEVEAGDRLIGFDEEPYNGDGKTRRWRVSTVTSNPEIMKPCYRIYFEDGSTMVASEKHGWLTHSENVNRWKTTDQLVTSAHRPGRPTRITRLVDMWEPDNSWESGYIAAAFDGEGHLSQHPRKDHEGSHSFSVGFAQRSNEMLETVDSILSGYGFKTSTSSPNGGDTVQRVIKGGKPEVMRFMGQFRPKRLMPKFDPAILGEIQAKNNVAVVRTEYIGEQTVMGLETDTKTYIAEGFASHNSEYHHQRPSCEYFLGIAEGMGLKVFIPDEADLLKTRFLYGFGESEKSKWDKKIQGMIASMEQRKATAEHQYKHAETQINQYVGALMAVREVNKIWD